MTSPELWDLKTFLDNWHAHLRGIIDKGETALPFERLLFQSQADPAYETALANWSKMPGDERIKTWETLTAISEKGKDEMLPICVRCGVCCQNGSPTLAKADLELVVTEQIPLSALMTVRAGEPVHSRTLDRAYYLPEEKIKIRERPGSKACAMYDDETKSCGLHPHKPAQCRAQACWDPSLGSEQAMAPALTRREVLEGADGVLTLIDAHEKRVPFAGVVEAFETLATSGGENISSILEMLGFDEHIREFAGKELAIPADTLDFMFGRSLVDRVGLFGFRVEREADGSRILLPLTDRSDRG